MNDRLNKKDLCNLCSKELSACQCKTTLIAVGLTSLNSALGASLSKGDTIAHRYEVESCLGAGGMGEVYLAQHITLQRKCAVKILDPKLLQDDAVRKRLEAEAQICASLTHPNIVSVFDFGITDDNRPFLVMEFVEGIDLKDYLQRSGGSLEYKCILKLLLQIVDALAQSHAAAIIHRDLKPGNILIRNPFLADELVKIVDFGIAKSTVSGGELQYLTRTGELLGSPSYMSPEQIHGEAIDGRSDVYSLGCVLYEMLTGKQLFRRSSMIAALEANLKESPPAEVPGVTDDWQKNRLYKIMLKCLAKSPNDRYQTMDELKREILSLAATDEKNNKTKVVTAAIAGCLLIVSLVSGVTFVLTKSLTEKEIRNRVNQDFQKTQSTNGRIANLTPSVLNHFERACMMESEGVRAANSLYLEALSRAETSNAPVSEQCDIAAEVMRVYWKVGEYTVIDSTFQRMLPKLRFLEDAADKARTLNKTVAVGSAPLLYYYASESMKHRNSRVREYQLLEKGRQLSMLHPDANWLVPEFDRKMSENLIDSNQYKRAESLLLESCEKRLRYSRNDETVILEDLYTLVEVSLKLKEPEAAKKHLARAQEIVDRIPKSSDTESLRTESHKKLTELKHLVSQ